MSYIIRQRLGYLAVSTGIFLIDQLTKHEATSLVYGSSLRVIDGVFHLTYIENAGIAWGFFSDAGSLTRGILGVISMLAVLGILIYGARTPMSERVTLGGLALVLGGVLGNLADRIYRGAVVDFLDFTIGSYKWPTFNIADTAICLGAFLLVLDAIRAPAERAAPPPSVESVASE